MAKKRVDKQERRQKLLRQRTQWEKAFAARLTAAGIVFEEQRPIGCYFADFLLPHQGVIIELDGKHHLEPERLEYDKRRDRHLIRRGFQVIRIANKDAGHFSLDALRPKRQKPKQKRQWADRRGFVWHVVQE